MSFTKLRRLLPGDTVAVISPSWGGPSLFPAIYKKGLQVLQEELGLKVEEYPTARAEADFLYHHPQARAEDINRAFGDPEIKAIITTIGGDDSVRILRYLDPGLIRNNPKILMGFSDTTTLLVYGILQGLVTFQGPSLMAGLTQWHSFPEAFRSHVKTMLFEGPDAYSYSPYEVWSEGYPDWGRPEDAGKINPAQSNETRWQWLQGESVVSGELFGGCIEVLEFLKGTLYWPQPAFWQGKILFLEISEEKPSPTQVKYMLRNYGVQGIFDRIQGVLFGRPRDYTPEEKESLREAIRAVIATEFGRPDLPVVLNMDFGHTDPQFILPLGIKAELDCRQQTFKLVESPFVGEEAEEAVT
jgi:muramoyltetrapeptide carboxypeptidase LdcA involved in peptidoglycan recycling